mgnify:CR=1 FL=1
MQKELFPKEEKPNDQHLWNQFIKLGEMIGDGLHEEPDGKWISREYKQLAKILVPEIKESLAETRKIKNQTIDEQVKKLLDKFKSKCCNVDLKQARSGSLIVYCSKCNHRYKAVKSK